MAITDNLKTIILRQKEILRQLEEETISISNNDLAKENDELKTKLEEIKSDFFETKEKLKEIYDENASLKNALYEKIYNEKISILNLSQNKLDVYFKSNLEGEKNRLLAFENKVKDRIDNMTNELLKNNIDIKDEIYQKLDELSVLLNQKVTNAIIEANKQTGAFSENEKEEFKALENEQITNTMIRESAKKSNFESFIGLNLLNKLGILLIIIGVIVASQYTYFKLPDILKAIMIFGLGGIMLIVGEILNKKKANIFSLGITAGGVGVLYIALATSFFMFKILDMYPAIGLCILITAGAFLLSTRYNAQVILAFALVGGYLPMFSIYGNASITYGAMIYFIVLNLLAFSISFNKKWTVSSFIGLALNIAGTIYICSLVPYKAAFIVKVITISYVLFAFLIYSSIPVLGTYSQKLKFKKADVILLGINTFISSLIMYNIFYRFNLKDYYGLLAIAFAIIYLLLGKFIETKFTNEKNATALFYLTGLSFVVLIIPFQFGKAWLSLGWLVEGVALSTYGVLRGEKSFKKAGFIINALCLASFLIFDIWLSIDYLFSYKYLAITLGSLIILSSYIYKNSLSTAFEKSYKYLTIINLWFYSIYIICEELQSKLYSINYQSFQRFYICNALAIAVTFLIAFVSPRIKSLSDKGVKIISVVIYSIGILWLFIINLFSSPWSYYFTKTPISYTIIGTGIIIIISLISVIALYDLLKYIIMEKKLGVQWLPFVVSGYFVLILTQNLITHYNLAFSNASISIIYVITALLWIVFGFAKRYSFLRRFGLALSVLAVAKLFILDLSNLTKGYQIVSYFALGITLLAISFVYQYFNKRLELKTEVIADVKEDI